MVTGDSTSIAELSSQCNLEFATIKRRINLITDGPSQEHTLPDGFNPDDFSDSFARFRMWAGNIGALQRDKLSFDHRLRYSDVRIEVIRLLQQLLVTLTDLHSFVTGEREQETWYEGEGEQFDDLDDDSNSSEYESASEINNTGQSPVLVTESSQLLIVINDAIGSLLKLSILIYKSTRRAKFARSSREQQYNTRFDISHAEEVFPYASKNRPLIEKLGKANAQRRQWLTYRKRHHEKLSSPPEAGSKNLNDLRSQGHTDFRSHTRASSAIISTVPASSRLPVPSAVGPDDGSQATTFYDESRASRHGGHDRYEMSETSYSASSSSEIDQQQILLPRPPPESADGKPFECPFCFAILTVDSSRSWAKHVHSDLASYVCTFENCTEPLFESRHQWFQHEMEVHRRQWACSSCESLFPTSRQFEAHVNEAHGSRLGNAGREALLALASQPLQRIPASACPLCDYRASLGARLGSEGEILISLAKFRNHLGHHMEQLALFVLPKAYLHEDDEDMSQAEESPDNAESDISNEGDTQIPDDVSIAGNRDDAIESAEKAVSIVSMEADSTPHIFDSAPALALGWQPPQDFTPAAADFETEDPDLIPRREEAMFGGDLFTPGWVRGYDEAKEGFCGRCAVGHWVNIPDGTYEFHLTYLHGLPSTGLPLPRPSAIREVEGAGGMWEGFCDACQGWRLLKKTKRGWNWFRHWLTEHQYTINPDEDFENPPLQDAIKHIRKGQIELYKSLLTENPNLTQQTSHNSKTLLHYTAESGDIDLVRLTLDNMRSEDVGNSSIDARSALGTTPLMLSADQGNYDIVEELVKIGADVNITDNKGQTALDFAAHAGYASISQLLIRHGADIHKAKVFQVLYSKSPGKDNQKRTPPQNQDGKERDMASWNALMRNSYTNNLLGVKQCLESGTDIEATAIDGRAALMIAASKGNHEVVDLLLDMGANIDATNTKGWTTLMKAVRDNQHDTVNLLLSRGADVNHRARDNWTALTEAAQLGLTGIMKSLLQCHADTESRSAHDWTPLMHSCYKGDREGVLLLLAAGANVESGSLRDETPLRLAAATGHVEIVKILLSAGAHPEAAWARKADSDMAAVSAGGLLERAYPLGWTPLMVACQGGHTEVVRLLLQAGANVEPRSPLKKTALEIALEHGRADVVKILRHYKDTQKVLID